MAGSFADRVLALVMIDVIGILAWDATALPTHIAQAVAARRCVIRDSLATRSRLNRSHPVPRRRSVARSPEGFCVFLSSSCSKALEAPERGYANLDQAVDRRVATVATYPGKQSLSRDAAARMVARATVTDTSEAGVTTVRFRHDPRIKCPSPGVFTEEQACALLSAIRAPTFFVRGELGWPFKDAQVASRVAAIKAPFETVTLPGSHHLHIDPESAPAVADAIVGFLRRSLPALRAEGAEATAAAAGDAAGHAEGGAAGGGGALGGFEEAKDDGAGVRPHGHVVRPEDGVLVESEDRL